MNSKDLKERVFAQTTTGKRLENGMWELRCVIRESVTYRDGTKKEEEIESSCVDPDFDTAHQIALKSSLSEIGYLYSQGFDSLIEWVEYQTRLEKEDDSPKDNSDTSTQ
jgi:hypothetical protein